MNFRAIALSFFLHVVLLSLLFLIPSDDGPLAGSGGVTVILTEPASTNGGFVQSPKSDLKKSSRRRVSPPVPSPPPAVSSPAGSGAGFGAPGSGSGSEGNNPVLAAIRSRIERVKRYPLLAKQSRMEGRSLVSFQIGGVGQPLRITLKQSSGSEILDREALETVRRAAPFPVYAEALEVWIRFELSH